MRMHHSILTGVSTPSSFALLKTSPTMTSISIGFPVSQSKSMLALCLESGLRWKFPVDLIVSSTIDEGTASSSNPIALPTARFSSMIARMTGTTVASTSGS